MATPVYTISGFLGAGKTTFLNNLLSHVPENILVAMIINELGQIGIDGRIIEKKDYLLQEITQGCICCTLKAKLADALIAIVEDIAPDFILIETTGVARPKQIISEFHLKRLSEKVFSKRVITLLDAPIYARVGNKMPIINFQIQDADVIVLNKIDLVDEEILVQMRNQLNSLDGDGKRLYETSFGKLPYEILFPDIAVQFSGEEQNFFEGAPEVNALELDISSQHDPSFHGIRESTEGFESVSVSLDSVISQNTLKAFFEAHGEKIIRGKGILKTEKGNRILHFSSSGLKMEDYGQRLLKSELVVIAKDQDIDTIKASLFSTFDNPR